jgi:hypothetical protein
MTKPKIVEVGFVESSSDLGGFLGEAYGALQELRREAKALKLDLPGFPDLGGEDVPNSVFDWVGTVGASTCGQECNEDDGAPGGSSIGRVVYYRWRDEKAIERKAEESVQRGREIIMVQLLKKYGLADLEVDELDDFLAAATEPKPPG